MDQQTTQKQVDDKFIEALNLASQANTHQASNDLQKAFDLYNQAITMFEQNIAPLLKQIAQQRNDIFYAIFKDWKHV